jgi:hypothetical protein
MSPMGQKRPKLLWLLTSKSTTEQRGKFVPQPDLPHTETLGTGKAEKLEFLADARSKPRSVRFHTVRPQEAW